MASNEILRSHLHRATLSIMVLIVFFPVFWAEAWRATPRSGGLALFVVLNLTEVTNGRDVTSGGEIWVAVIALVRRDGSWPSYAPRRRLQIAVIILSMLPLDGCSVALLLVILEPVYISNQPMGLFRGSLFPLFFVVFQNKQSILDICIT